jgi:integrase
MAKRRYTQETLGRSDSRDAPRKRAAAGKFGGKRVAEKERGAKQDERDDTGAAIPLLKVIEREFPNNPRKQWEELMSQLNIVSMTGRARQVGDGTDDLYCERGHTCISDLRAKEVKIHLQNVSEFNKKHAYALIGYWATTKRALQSDPDSSSQLQNLTTVARRICKWNGFPNAVPKSLPKILVELGLDPALARRQYMAVESKAPSAKGFDPQDIVRAAYEELGVVAGLMIEGSLLFGFREREILEFRPEESDLGDKIHIFRGVKNGNLSRFVPIQTQAQRDWLDRAKAVCKKHAKGILTFQPMGSIDAAISHLQYLCGDERFGLTKKGRWKTTFHGLRHQFAQEMYKRECGYDAPVVSGLPVPKEIDRIARQKVTNALGHHRISVTGAYLGSNTFIEGPKRRVMDATLARFGEEPVREALTGYGITRLVLAGELAEGVHSPTAMTLCAWEGAVPSEPAQADQLLSLLEATSGTRCCLVPLSNAVMRGETLEVF